MHLKKTGIENLALHNYRYFDAVISALDYTWINELAKGKSMFNK